MRRFRIARMAQMALFSLAFAVLVRPATGQGKYVRKLGQIGGGSKAIEVKGRYAYVAEGSILSVVDVVTSPPKRVGNISVPDIIEDIQVSGATAYVAAGYSGLHIVNVTNPTSPTLRGSYNTPGSAKGVFVVGNMAYVADWVGGFHIIDAGNPSSPRLRSSIQIPGLLGQACYPFDVFVVNNRAYIVDGWKLAIYDVTNPDAPAPLGSYPIYDSRTLCVTNNRAYVGHAGTNGGIEIIDVTKPTSPTLLGRWISGRLPRGVYVSNNLAYVANEDRGLAILDVGTATTPTLRGTYYPTTPYSTEDVVASGTLVFLALGARYYANDHCGFDMFNVANPAQPVFLSSYETVGTAEAVRIVGTKAYIAGGWNDLQIVDLSDPKRPTLMGFYNNPGASSEHIFVSGNRAYLSYHLDRLLIVDVTNPKQPSLLARHYGYYWPFVISNQVYLNTSRGFEIVDFTDPLTPKVLGYASGYNGKPFLLNNRAYLADGENGLHILDVSVPSSPQWRSTYKTADLARDVFVSGNFAYVAAGDLLILNVSDPTSPVLIASRPTPGGATGVCVSGTRLYVSDYGTLTEPDQESGLLVYDLRNPRAPTLLGKFALQSAFDVDVSGGLAYVGDDSTGLWILEYLGSGKAPRIQTATVVDKNGNQIVEQNDELIFTLDRSVSITPDRIFYYHFFFPVQYDDFGGSAYAFSVNPYNSRQIVVTLGLSVSLTPKGVFSMQNRAPDSPSGIDFAAYLPQELVTSLDGLSAVDGGLLGVDDSGIDLKFSMVEQEVAIPPIGGSVKVVSSPDAEYTRHELVVPPGALTATTRFRLAAPPEDGGVVGAVQVRSSNPTVRFATSATLRVEYREGDIDKELGHIEGEMRVHQLVKTPQGQVTYVPVQGAQILDRYQRLVLAELTGLNPRGSAGIIGVFAGLPIETVDERTIHIKKSAGGIIKGAQPVALAPGPNGAYLGHKIEFPGYVATTSQDSARLVVTMRTAKLAQRFGPTGGRSFPPDSGAVFLVTVSNASGQPVRFADPVHLTVQFKDRPDRSLGDCVRFSGQPAPAANMRLVYDRLAGEAVDFEFVSGPPQTVNIAQGTIRVQNLVGLTGSDGCGTFGAVALEAAPTARWSLYR